jgi:hypothetical protein
MNVANYTTKIGCLDSWFSERLPDCWQPLRQWLNHLPIRDSRQAHHICRLIPAQCPFARQIQLFGRTLLTIPPLCQLNPLYTELIALRFRAMSYLADECGEDVGAYC